jgi:putative transposase
LKTPELVIVDGAPGLEKALVALWSDVPVERCTVHKHRNLLAHAPERLQEEISNDYKDMIYAETSGEIETKRKAFIHKWRLRCKAVADSLEEAGDKLFTFTRFPQSQWKSIRTHYCPVKYRTNSTGYMAAHRRCRRQRLERRGKAGFSRKSGRIKSVGK